MEEHELMNTTEKSLSNLEMSERVFRKLGAFIETGYGIKMPPVKKTMLQSRLLKRLRVLGINSFETYCDYIFETESEEEITHMVNAVSTNKTDFFRESAHFTYLIRNAIPEIVEAKGKGPVRIWSAGCSTGEEPYTIAMVLNAFAEDNPDFNYRILATDVSTEVLEKAMAGIYTKQQVAPVPMNFRKKYLLKNKDPKKNLVRVVPEIRKRISFQQLNFLDAFRLKEKVHVIFCRNVIIYFDMNLQKELMEKFYDNLLPGGFLFIGHSETLNRLNVPFKNVAPTIYRKL